MSKGLMTCLNPRVITFWHFITWDEADLGGGREASVFQGVGWEAEGD